MFLSCDSTVLRRACHGATVLGDRATRAGAGQVRVRRGKVDEGTRLAALQLAGQVSNCVYGARPHLAQLLHEELGHIDLLEHRGHGDVDRQELLAAHRLDHTLPGKCVIQYIS